MGDSGPLLLPFNFSGSARPAPHHKVTMWPLAAAISFLMVAWSGGKNASRGGGGGVATANNGRRREPQGAASSASSPLVGGAGRVPGRRRDSCVSLRDLVTQLGSVHAPHLPQTSPWGIPVQMGLPYC